MNIYEFKLVEEIARWAFEVVCKLNDDWYIAFSNPTAGPWKSIKAIDKNGIEGKVYTFDLLEKRPDIILVNDKLKVIIIIEAKDKYENLIKEKQIIKSSEVVVDLSKILKKERNNKFWGKRYMYNIFVGLLWGANKPISLIDKEKLFDLYHKETAKDRNIDGRLIIGVEVIKDNDILKCSVCGKNYENGNKTINISDMSRSLSIPEC